MSNIFTKPRGTQDMLYDKARSYNKIVDILNSVATNYGASPIQIPMYEESRLFKRGVGNSTDIVMKETFDLANKGDHDYSLRPEFTAGIMRAIIENKLYASPDLPLKLYYSGSIFRYERPQQGRYREPHQWGIEFTDLNLDDSTVAEAILVMVDGLKALGIDPIIKLNNLGGDISRSNYRKALVDYFTPLKDKLCTDCQKRLELNPLRILDCKVPEDHELVLKAPLLKDYLIDEDKKKFAKLLELLDSCNVKYTLDDKIKSLKDNQSAFGWIFSFFSKKDSNMHISLSCNEDLLEDKVNNLNCFKEENITEPKSAYLQYENGEYKIVKEEGGTKVKKEQLLSALKESIKKGEYTINLEKEDCYEKPKYTLESEELTKIKETLDKYVSTKITYEF